MIGEINPRASQDALKAADMIREQNDRLQNLRLDPENSADEARKKHRELLDGVGIATSFDAKRQGDLRVFDLQDSVLAEENLQKAEARIINETKKTINHPPSHNKYRSIDSAELDPAAEPLKFHRASWQDLDAADDIRYDAAFPKSSNNTKEVWNQAQLLKSVGIKTSSENFEGDRRAQKLRDTILGTTPTYKEELNKLAALRDSLDPETIRQIEQDEEEKIRLLDKEIAAVMENMDNGHTVKKNELPN